MPNPGRLDQRITFQERVLTSDGQGGSTEALANIATVPTVWAQVVQAGGGERLYGGRTIAESQVMFIVRERDDINETHTIIWRSEPYNIRQVSREGTRRMYMDIIAERGVQQ